MSETFEVLLVDDEEIVCKRLRPAVEKMGCAVETSMELRAALDRIDEKSFDVVVTDLRTDGIDGIQVLEHVQQRSPRTKVVVITGTATMTLAREVMQKGGFDFLSKPFKPEDLRRVILAAAEELGKPLDYEVPPAEPNGG